jgi:glucokinase
MLTLTLDIGGTKIAAGLVDQSGTLVQAATQPTPKNHGAEEVWALTHRMIADAIQTAGGGVGAIGIASAGPIDLAMGTVSPINIPSWRGFPLRDRVAAAVPGVPVRLAGDGVCMALGEHWRGAGRGVDFLLGMVVSTGVGWCSTGRPITGGPAMPDMSVTSWSNWTGSRAPAAATAAWRRSRPDRG